MICERIYPAYMVCKQVQVLTQHVFICSNKAMIISMLCCGETHNYIPHVRLYTLGIIVVWTIYLLKAFKIISRLTQQFKRYESVKLICS